MGIGRQDRREPHLRVLAFTLPRPELATAPSWLIANCQAIEYRKLTGLSVLTAAKNLICMRLMRHPDQQASIEPMPNGAVKVQWENSSLRWYVDPIGARWPVVNVQAYWVAADADTLAEKSKPWLRSKRSFLAEAVVGAGFDSEDDEQTEVAKIARLTGRQVLA